MADNDSVNLAILVPSQDYWVADFAVSVLAMQQMLSYHPIGDGFRMNLINERGSLIDYQRENLALKALEMGATHTLWLDSDMRFPPDIVHKLIKHDTPMVACNYVKRAVPAMPNSKGLDGKLIATNRDTTGLQVAESAGFGVALIKAEVFEKMPRPWFDQVWMDRDGEIDKMGEDVFFFKKARVNGFTLFVDHDASQHIGHVGTFEYSNAMCEATWDEVDLDDVKREIIG